MYSNERPKEGPYQGNRPPKKTTDKNLPTNDVENINSTNKGRDLLLASPRNRKDAVKDTEETGELLYIDQ